MCRFHRFPSRPAAAVLVALAAMASPTGAAGPGCQIVIGSCHRAPLSTPEGKGIVDRVAIEAFRRIGYRACIEALPCERSLRNADAGVTDGDLLRIPEAVLPKTPNLAAVPEMLYAVPVSAFAMRPDLKVQGLADLLPLRVGYVLGWKILEDQVRAVEVLRVRGPEELFSLLADDKADIVLYERNTGLHLAKTQNWKGIRVIDPPLIITRQHLVLHRRHGNLLEPLAAALREMKRDGSYAASFHEAGFAPPEAR